LKQVRVFTFIFATALIALLSFQLNSPAVVAFQPGRTDTPALLKMDRFPSLIHARAKMVTALGNARFTYGLFGNSRSLMVGRGLLDLPVEQYFNFSLSGQSFRNSVMLLEWLDEVGKLPEFAIISVDHFGLEFFGNGTIPSLSVRFRSLARDLQSIHNFNGSERSYVRATWRFAWSLWQDVKMTFSATSLFHATELLLGIRHKQLTLGYRSDGSRKQTHRTKGHVLPTHAWQPGRRQIDLALMQIDLRTLRDLQERRNVTILIYESPIHPKLQIADSRHHKIRKLFFKTCLQFDLECISTPSLGPLDPNDTWSDWTHAPESLLAAWLKTNVLDRTINRDTSR
jgi:hypothetical protein